MENIQWLEEVTKRKESILEDLFRQLRIPSVREDDKATEDAPVGPGPKAALEDFMAMAKEDGFTTKQYGPWAGRVEFGEGEELLGILGHLDVVPVGTGWETDPFEPQIIDEKIYARGSSDDKGPTIAAYHAIKLLLELGVKFNKRIHLIIGTDEESGWQCMDHYFAEAEMPDFGFSPDGNFPIINGEKGNVSAIITQSDQTKVEGDYHLVSLNAGLRANMVPQDCDAVVQGADLETLAEAFDSFVKEHPNHLKGSYEIEGDQITFHLVGKAAHGSTPHVGVNAATHLSQFLANYTFNQQDANHLVQMLSHQLYEGFDGSGIGVNHTHDVMGELSMNVGVVNYQDRKGMDINVNFRYPEGTNPERIHEGMQKALTEYSLSIEMGEAKEPHYVPADDPMVETLLQVYENQTGEKGYEKTIGGGTYGRLMPRGVAYGALFPDSTDTMHQANEFFSVSDLLRCTAIYAEAIYRLTR